MNESKRYKARLVAKGFSQKYGQDYDQVFAPVVKQTTLRTLLAIASMNGMTVQHIDVKTAFLNGYLENDIYLKQPPVPTFCNLVENFSHRKIVKQKFQTFLYLEK